VIEGGGGPSGGSVTQRTIRFAAGLSELASMDILMAADASLGRTFEVHVRRRPGNAGGPVTVKALKPAMRAIQRESCGCVVERLEIPPGRELVAGFAGVLAGLRGGKERRGEVAVVGILVANLAAHLSEVEAAVRTHRGFLLAMAVETDDRGVRSSQRELRGLMTDERECGRTEAIDGMAVFATVVKRGARELAAVRIAMTVVAGLECRVVVRCNSSGSVALPASDSAVLAQERKAGRLVIRLRERCGAESLLGVTGGAVRAIGAARELSFVLVLMAIEAACVGDGDCEIGGLVTFSAGEAVVLSQERKLRTAMVERGGDAHLPPGVGVVAGLTARRERAAVRVLVAAGALGKVEMGVLDDFRVVRHRAVALRAGDVLVAAGQREVRRVVIEGSHRLPLRGAVALLAIRTQLAGMAILVARAAGGGEAQERLAQFLGRNVLALADRYAGGVVALLALESGVPAEEGKAGFAVVELFLGRRPADDAEFCAVVFGMATRAVEVSLSAVDGAAVIALLLGEQLANGSMAVDTVQFGAAGAEDVATGTLQGAVQEMMRIGKSPWRDLSGKHMGETEDTDCVCDEPGARISQDTLLARGAPKCGEAGRWMHPPCSAATGLPREGPHGCRMKGGGRDRGNAQVLPGIQSRGDSASARS